MTSMRALRLAGASAFAVLSIAAAPAANAVELLTNGGFEDSGAAVLEGWGGYTYGGAYSLPLPGWDVDYGSADIVTNTTLWSPAYEGEQALDINGFEAGSISQSFDTVLGRKYKVTYAYSRNPAGAEDPATATISAGGNSVFVSAANGDFGGPNSMTWKTNSFTFIGDGSSNTITLSTDNSGPGGVFFDDVSIAVPEPATWALMIGGFGMAGAALRRRRSLAAA